jgi:hypothetical protein
VTPSALLGVFYLLGSNKKTRRAKMIKKTVILISLLTTLVIPRVFAAGNVIVSVGNISGSPGELVMVPVALNDASGLGIISGDFKVDYDASLLTLTKIEAGTLNNNWGNEVKAGEIVPWVYPFYKPGSGTAQVALYGINALTGEGSIANLTFQINAAAKSGASSPVELKSVKFNDGISVLATVVNGSITVEGSLRGDLNNNGYLDINDIRICIDLYLNDQYSVIADLNNNAMIDINDIRIVIDLYLAG